MQQVVNSSLPPFRSPARTALRIIFALLIPIAIASAEEPAATTTVAKLDSITTAFRVALETEDSVGSLGNVSVPHLQYRMMAMTPITLRLTSFRPNTSREQSFGFYRHDWLRHGQDTDERTSFWDHLQAGYGQFCESESSFWKNSLELERPSCTYLKARFRF